MGFAFTPEDTQNLSVEQKAAILESLAVAVVADGKTSKAETDQYDRELSGIRWWMEDAQVVQMAQQATGKVMSTAGPDAIIALVQSIGARLDNPVVRDKTWRAMASIMASDGALVPAELQVLAAFAKAFEMTTERIEAVKADIGAAYPHTKS